jgi:citrate lyase gamma subunit
VAVDSLVKLSPLTNVIIPRDSDYIQADVKGFGSHLRELPADLLERRTVRGHDQDAHDEGPLHLLTYIATRGKGARASGQRLYQEARDGGSYPV